MAEITKEELKALLKSNKPAIIIDVRRDEEIQAGTIENAKHVELDKIKRAFGDLTEDQFKKEFLFERPPKDCDHVYTLCRGGVRSAKARDIINELGWKLVSA